MGSVQSIVEIRVVVTGDRRPRAFVRRDNAIGGWVLNLAEHGRQTLRLNGQEALDAFIAGNLTLDEAAALTAMRQAATTLERARIVGGRRGDLGVSDPETMAPLDRYGGEMPGTYQETIQSLPGVPVAIRAAYGGAAREAAFDIGILGDGDPQVPYRGAEQKCVAEARVLLRDTWTRLPAARQDQQARLAGFARRDDGPMLACDLVRTLASMISAP